MLTAAHTLCVLFIDKQNNLRFGNHWRFAAYVRSRAQYRHLMRRKYLHGPACLAHKDEARTHSPRHTANMKYTVKAVTISRRSRTVITLLRWVLKPLLRLFSFVSVFALIRNQVRLASRWRIRLHDLPINYDRYINGVPGPIVGDFSATDKTAILYLHGGAFLIPAVPAVHLELLARMCRKLDAVGFMPDYRLAPMHSFPQPLEDCERAYRGLLDAGFKAHNIVIAGESAGGNLTLGLLQRIRANSWPMPACAIPISPVTELARVHVPLSRGVNRRKDPLLPINAMAKMLQMYAGDHDATDPEMSPIYADMRGMPPLFFLVGESEILLDDTLIVAEHARQAGVSTRVDVWPLLPHAFPLFINLLPEALQARNDMIEFIRAHTQNNSQETE